MTLSPSVCVDLLWCISSSSITLSFEVCRPVCLPTCLSAGGNVTVELQLSSSTPDSVDVKWWIDVGSQRSESLWKIRIRHKCLRICTEYSCGGSKSSTYTNIDINVTSAGRATGSSSLQHLEEFTTYSITVDVLRANNDIAYNGSEMIHLTPSTGELTI